MENVKKKNNLLAEFLGLTAQGTIIRSRYQSVELIDAPSKNNVNLEKKNGQKNLSLPCSLKTEFY